VGASCEQLRASEIEIWFLQESLLVPAEWPGVAPLGAGSVTRARRIARPSTSRGTERAPLGLARPLRRDEARRKHPSIRTQSVSSSSRADRRAASLTAFALTLATLAVLLLTSHIARYVAPYRFTPTQQQASEAAPRLPPPFARSPGRSAAFRVPSARLEAARASTNLGEVGRPQRQRREDGPVWGSPPRTRSAALAPTFCGQPRRAKPGETR
jgi:hypothetical protein